MITPIEGQPNLFRDTDTGQIFNIHDFKEATWTLFFEEATRASLTLEGQAGLVAERIVRLPRACPAARLRIAVNEAFVTEWCEISAFSYTDEQTALVRRLERLEIALAHDLKTKPFGALHRRISVPVGGRIMVELDRPLTCAVTLSGLARRPAG
jgi:hypothetical protein